MGKNILCRDAGVDCDWKAQAGTEEELLKKVRQHAKETHSLAEMPPELIAKVKSAMRDQR